MRPEKMENREREGDERLDITRRCSLPNAQRVTHSTCFCFVSKIATEANQIMSLPAKIDLIVEP